MVEQKMIIVTGKFSHSSNEMGFYSGSENAIKLDGASVVQLPLNREDIKSVSRDGNDLTIVAQDGTVYILRDFFLEQDGVRSDLVLQDDQGSLWFVGINEQGSLLEGFYELASVEPLLVQEGGGEYAAWLLPLLLFGGAAGAGFGAGYAVGDESTPEPEVVTETVTETNTNTEYKYLTKPAIGDVSDNVGQRTGTIKNGDTTDDNTPTLNGNGEPGSVVAIYDNGKLLGTAKVGDDGTWTFTPKVELPDGNHSLTVKTVDPEGNVVDGDSSISFVVDTKPVELSVTKAIDDFGKVVGDVYSGSVTDDNAVQLVGKGTPGSTITVTDENGVIQGEVTVDKNGSWILQLPEQADGDHTYTVTATNPAGNSVDETFELTVDQTAPPPAEIGTAIDDVGDTVGNVENNGVTDDTKPTISGEGAEPGSTINVYDGDELIAEGVVVNPDGSWSFTPDEDLSEGDHSFSTTVKDEAGNESDKSGDFTITIDTTPPGATTGWDLVDNAGEQQGTIENGSVTDDRTPTYSGVADADTDRVEIWDEYNGVKTLLGTAKVDEDGNWSFEPDAELRDGDHVFTNVPVDKAGNKGEESDGWQFTVEIEPIVVPSIETVADDFVPNVGYLEKNDVTNDTTLTVAGRGEAGSTIYLYSNGEEVGQAVVGDNGRWSITTSDLGEDGLKDLTAKAVNTATGQSSDETGAYPVYLDRNAPDAPSDVIITDDVGDEKGPIDEINNITDDGKPTFEGTGEPGSTIDVIIDGESVGTVVVGPEGTWELTPDEAL
ncbi:Ig-like domain-containing protein, partial [Desulforhopalus singaporensis]